MDELKSDRSAPWHLWFLGIVLLLWQGLAAFDYIATVIRYEPYLSAHSEEVLSYYFNAPLWMYFMWGVGSIGGLVGAILILMRKSSAVLLFGLAWICSLFASIYSMVNPPPGGENTLFLGIVLFVSLIIVLYLYKQKKSGILR